MHKIKSIKIKVATITPATIAKHIIQLTQQSLALEHVAPAELAAGAEQTAIIRYVIAYIPLLQEFNKSWIDIIFS